MHFLFISLFYSGHILESAIHAARAKRLGDKENFEAYFEQAGEEFAQGKALYHFLYESKTRHFLFFPIASWSYYQHYTSTLAILLARMGQRVTVMQHGQVHVLSFCVYFCSKSGH